MSNFYNNPENALRRANEFLELGKEDEAVDCLYDILKNKKNRILKTVHEAAINKLLEICVDRRMSATAKDGLYFYRMLCFGINIRSWEDSVRKLISLAEQKIEINTEELVSCDIGIVNPLDQAVTPENLSELVSYSSDDKDKKRIALFPWIKFNWECYRICLELLRNTQVENFYHHVAQKALHFCLKYQRKTEFRKLCHVLKVHLGFLYKQKSQVLSNVNNPETLMLYLETETVELEIALELELWQEVYKAIENLHFLIGIVKRQGNSRVIANYYKKLSHVFLKTGDSLYHAAAFFRYFSLTREQKKSLNLADVTAMSSALVLAVLAIPFSPNDPTIVLLAESDLSLTEKKHYLLSELLNFPSKLSRKTLIKDLECCGVIQAAQVEVQGLFYLLESELDPLDMGNRILSFTKAFSESSSSNQKSLNMYLKSILDVSVTHLLSQLSKIYESMTWKKFLSLVPISDDFHVEWLVVETARRYNISVRLDHMKACLRFDKSQFFQSSSNEDGLEVHQLPEDINVNYLSQVYTSLGNLGRKLNPENVKEEGNIVRKIATEQYLKVLGEDRKGILKRKKIIEKHKEMVENMRLKKEEQERKLMTAKQLEFETAEKERLLKETAQRAHQKRILLQEEIRKKILYDKIEILKKSELGDMIEKLDISELEDLDPEVIFSKHFEQVVREKKGFISRLRKQDRTNNHMERAKRIEEVPLLQEKYEEETSITKSMWEKDEKRRIEMALEERAHNVKEKGRLLVMKNDLNDFVGKVMERKRLEYVKDSNDFQKTLEQEREKRLKERAVQRKMQRRLEWIVEQEEAKMIRVKYLQSIAEERKNNKSLNETSSYSERKYGCSKDSLKGDKCATYNKRNQINRNETQKFSRKLPNAIDNLSENQSLKEDNCERRRSNTYENQSKEREDYASAKYQNKNQIRETSPNKRYNDQREQSEREFRKQNSAKIFTKNIDPILKSQTAKKEANIDCHVSERNYKESEMKSTSMYHEKNTRSPERKYRLQKENPTNYSNSPTIFAKKSDKYIDNQVVNETSIGNFSASKIQMSPRKSQQKITILKHEDSSRVGDKTSNKYNAPRNKYSDSTYNYDKPPKNTLLEDRDYAEMLEPCYRSNLRTLSSIETKATREKSANFGAHFDEERSRSKILDDRYSEMLEPCYRSNAKTFTATETEANRGKSANFDARFKQERSGSKDFGDQNYFARNLFNPQQSGERIDPFFDRRYQTKPGQSINKDEKISSDTNKSLKFEVKHSCTPWAKLQREKE